MDDEFDVIIVGAGIAGALMAWKLAAANANVLLLEAGEHSPERVDLVGTFAVASLKTPRSPYKGRAGDIYAPSPEGDFDYYEQDPKGDLYKSTYERRVGGTTWHWLGNAPRLIPNDFRLYSQYGVGKDWPITYLDLEPWYGAAERAIGVSGDHEEWQDLLGAHRSEPFPMTKIWTSHSDGRVKEAIKGLTYEGREIRVVSTPQARNSQPYQGRPLCAGNSICVPICPIKAKYDATVHVEMAQSAGVKLRSQCVVTRLQVGEDMNVKGLTYKTWDNVEHTVTGKIVILAANAIETPKLLLMSASDRFPKGVANGSDQVGRNLMDHLQGAGTALSREPLFPFRGPPTTSGIDVFRDGDFRRQHGAFRMSLGNDGWGRVESPYDTIFKLVKSSGFFGTALRGRLVDRITRQFRISYSTEVLPSEHNRVQLSANVDGLGIPKPKLSVVLDDYNRNAFRKAWDVMRTIFTAMKADEIATPTDPNKYSGAGHIMGTCRMGKDPADSVVDSECRSHEHRNLFIIGSSVFPTGGTANPTLTIAALTLRAVGSVQDQLRD
jgi:choline dehydrogenase-like flavoprotein